MEEVINSIENLENRFNNIYNSALSDKDNKNRYCKIESMRLIMYDMNSIKEEPDNDVHIQKIVFEKQLDMAQKFSNLATIMGPF